MEIKLYTNKSDPNHLTKDKDEKGTIQAVMKDGCDIINPVLKIEALPAYSFNYIYISKFDRFYYVLGGVSYVNGIWEIKCHVDVLASNKVEILQQTAVIERQEYKYNLNLDDGTLKAYSNPITVIRKFPKSINDFNNGDGGTNVLLLGGGENYE